MYHNNNCDGSGPCISGEVRVLRIAGTGENSGNAILCAACFRREIRWRVERNRELSPDCRFDLPAWSACKVYQASITVQ